MLYELQIIFIVNSPAAYICRNETELGLLSFDDDAHNFAALCRGEEMRTGGTGSKVGLGVAFM